MISPPAACPPSACLQERGFVYVHTPIITGSDCEGAGEMFQVRLELGEPSFFLCYRSFSLLPSPSPYCR